MTMFINANALHIPLPDKSVQCCVTSPPYYGLRDYNVSGQIGLEQTPEIYVSNIVSVFREVWRVLKDDGTVWVNMGDSYTGSNMTGGNNGINSQGTYKIARQFKKDTKASITGLKPKDLIGIPWRAHLCIGFRLGVVASQSITGRILVGALFVDTPFFVTFNNFIRHKFTY